MGIDLLPNVDPTTVDIRRIKRKNRICKLSGHIFYELSRDESTGYTVIECQRCFPHKSSRRAAYLYDLFPTPVEPS